MSEKVREFWFIKNNLGTAICFAEIPPSKSYKKYIDKSAYDRLAEINKVLVEALESLEGSDFIISNSEGEKEYYYSAIEIDSIVEEALAKAKEMGNE